MQPSEQRVHFEVFKGSFKSWQRLLQEAAAFAERIDPERLIGISHSSGMGEGVVTVWYWSEKAKGT